MWRVARAGTWVGAFACVLVVSKVHAAYVAEPAYDFTGSSRFGWALAYAVLLAVAAYAVGLPDQVGTLRSWWVRVLAAWVLAAVAISTVQLVVGDALLPRFVVAGTLAPLLVVLGAWTWLASADPSRGDGVDRVVVVAEPDGESGLERELQRAPERAAVIVGRLDPVAAAAPGALSDAVAALGATLVVLDRRAQDEPTVVAQAAALHESGTRVRSMTNFCEQWLGKLPLTELERTSLFFDISEVHRRPVYVRVKRTVDVALALLGLVALVPVTLVVAVVDPIANRGPLLYRQRRVGRGGTEFTILKFRTMRESAGRAGGGEGDGEWTGRDDARVTPFGRLLRSTHLDELPQVLNVLRGDLSIVGPRPEQPRYVEQLAATLPYYRMRHLVRPGLTGWAQVKFGYAGDERDALEKLQYEMYYLRNQSLSLDVRTIVRTVRTLFGGLGAGR